MKSDEAVARNPDRPSSMSLVHAPELSDKGELRTFKRISSPERWELQQMRAAKAIDISEMPDFDEETGLLPKQDDSGLFGFMDFLYLVLSMHAQLFACICWTVLYNVLFLCTCMIWYDAVDDGDLLIAKMMHFIDNDCIDEYDNDIYENKDNDDFDNTHHNHSH